MKPTYLPIALQSGIHQAGIVSIEIAPREWLNNNIVSDFLTKNVSNNILLQTGKSFMQLDFTHPSYTYDEKPKKTKAGDYKEVTISGVLNSITPTILSTLQTFSYHEHIAIVTDTEGYKRIIGNKDNGLSFSAASKNSNIVTGSKTTAVEMVIELEEPPPFFMWAPSNALQSQNGHYILTPNGNYILIG